MSGGEVELLIGVLSAMLVALVALAISLVRTRERITRVEEWVRLHNGHGGGASVYELPRVER